MTPKLPRITSTARAGLAALLLAAWMAACAPPPPASTPVPPTTAPTETVAPATATTAPTDTDEPATVTASPEAATNTPRPTRTPAPSRTPAATETEAAATAAATNTTAAASPVPAGDFSPTQAQVWTTTVVGGDNQSGSCSATANAPYGLVLLTPGEGTLAMHNTVPEDYVLTRLGPNTYQYAGPAFLGDGNITIDIVFTSATTLEMTRTFVPSAEPGCTHQHRYTGEFRNNR